MMTGTGMEWVKMGAWAGQGKRVGGRDGRVVVDSIGQ